MAIIKVQQSESRFQTDLRMGENASASDSLFETAEGQNRDTAPLTIDPRDNFSEERLQSQPQLSGTKMDAAQAHAVAHAACVIL
ncbi:hypothetical protein ABW20_dc0105339 [Dactylellina cionopaga]|nr:hypothetical protein ABW20_dc0105339 [Dactylellina cionopaga]